MLPLSFAVFGSPAPSGAGQRSSRPPLDAGVADVHLTYESGLVTDVLGRLTPGDGAVARRVQRALDRGRRVIVGAQGAERSSAERSWQQEVGDGSPHPGQAITFTCSVHVRQSDAADLAASSDAELPSELASVELSLLIEGRRLASEMRDAPFVSAALERSQREALHALVPLLIPSDRAYAAHA